MWFRFPEGTTGISVQGQEFGAEVEGSDGRMYFRAPDHFAPLIIDMPGFDAVGAPPNTDLPDLPQFDPERDSAFVRMSAQIKSLEAERNSLREENAALQSQLAVSMPSKPEDEQVSRRR